VVVDSSVAGGPVVGVVGGTVVGTVESPACVVEGAVLLPKEPSPPHAAARTARTRDIRAKRRM